jgi:hypothetical protein
VLQPPSSFKMEYGGAPPASWHDTSTLLVHDVNDVHEDNAITDFSIMHEMRGGGVLGGLYQVKGGNIGAAGLQQSALKLKEAVTRCF